MKFYHETLLVDGGLLLHEVLPHHNSSSYGTIVRNVMVKVCGGKEPNVHLLLDHYMQPSVKDCERQKRGDLNEVFKISSSEQQQRKKGVELLQNGLFKEEFAAFLMKEVRKEHFAAVIHNKIVYVLHGGKCVKLCVNSMGMLKVEEPEDYQANHEEADTLVIFHATKTSGNVLVRSSDTDVLVLLVSLAEKKSDSYFMMDYGSGNTCRFIDASGIAKILESNHPGLCEALIRFHALTGCDFTSAFYRKGKALPFSKLKKDPGAIAALRSLCTDNVNKTAVF